MTSFLLTPFKDMYDSCPLSIVSLFESVFTRPVFTLPCLPFSTSLNGLSHNRFRFFKCVSILLLSFYPLSFVLRQTFSMLIGGIRTTFELHNTKSETSNRGSMIENTSVLKVPYCLFPSIVLYIYSLFRSFFLHQILLFFQ